MQYIFLCLFTFLLLPMGAIANCIVQGNVQNTSNSPLADTQIRAFLGYMLAATTTTDKKGDFIFDDLSPGVYHIVATADGYQSSALGAVAKAHTPMSLSFFLKINPCSITGSIINEKTLKPIPGAILTVIDSNIIIDFTTSDAKGKFSFLHLPEGSYILLANAPNFQRHNIGATLSEDSHDISLTIPLKAEPGSITGFVTEGSSASPIASVITASDESNLFIAASTTNIDGSYTLSNLAPGQYIVKANAPHYQIETAGVSVNSSTETPINFKLQKNPAHIFGKVINQKTLKPIPGVTVSAFDGPILIASSLTDAQGSYKIENLNFGIYNLIAQTNAFQSSSSVANAIPGKTLAVDFALIAHPGSLSGYVKDRYTHKPIPGVAVSINDDFMCVSTMLTDNLGNYSTSGLPPGKYTIIASMPDYQNSTNQITITSDQASALDFFLQTNPGTFFGLVTDSSSAPMRGALVSVYENNVMVASTLTGDTGHYRIENLKAGHYTLLAQSDRFQTGESRASLSPGKEVSANFRLKLNPCLLTGSIINADSHQPLPQATIVISTESSVIRSTLSDTNGSFAFPDLAPGDYFLTINCPGYDQNVYPVHLVPGRTFSLTLPMQFTFSHLSGTVTDINDKKPIAEAQISLKRNNETVGYSLSDAEGHFSFNKIQPGSYLVFVSAKNYIRKGFGATVDEGKTALCECQLTELCPPKDIKGQVIVDQYLSVVDRIHSITWSASPSPDVVKYNIYRNGALVATVPATRELAFALHKQGLKDNVTYSVSALNSNGDESKKISYALK